jgi:hypothetical protein
VACRRLARTMACIIHAAATALSTGPMTLLIDGSKVTA